MSDIWMAIAVMALASVLAAYLAGTLLYSEKGQLVMLLLAISILGMFVFQLYFAGQLYWAKFVPNSAAIIYTNASAVFAGLAAGWAWRLPNTPSWRRSILAALLAGASVIAILFPLISVFLRPPPAGQDRWEGPVALQTGWATCSPTAAATLLAAEGIRADESDLIPLCLTDSDGTPTLGLYRGIKIMANRNNRDVEIVDVDLQQLPQQDDWPVLMAVQLPYRVQDPRFTQERGWIPGMGHSVVALGRTPSGEIIVGDPSAGLEYWTISELQVLWHRRGIRLNELPRLD